MKKIIRAAALILSFLFVFLAGCTAGGNVTDTSAPDVTTEPDVTTDAGDDDKLVIAKDGASEFVMIRPEDTKTGSFIENMSALRKKIKELYGAEILPKEDWEKGYSTENPFESDNFEILIGNTNRKESQDVIKTLGEQEYKICVIGNKIVIAGYTDFVTTLAVNEFMKETLAMAAEDNVYAIPKNFELSGKSAIQTLGDSDATLRVMTFNILGTDQDDPPRAQPIIDIVEKYQPFIFCVQECNKARYNNVLYKLKGYEIATTYHPGTTTVVYTPILYRTDKVQLIESGAEWLEKRYTKTNTKSLEWAIFKDLNTNDTFGVVNIHGAIWQVDSNYELPEGKTAVEMNALSYEWRVDNIRQMNAKMTALKEKYGEIPFIWTGDFNMNSESEAYKTAIGFGMADSEVTATDKRTSMRTTHTVGKAPTSGKSIDHIFGNDLVVFRTHNVCHSAEELKASDHCAVWVDLKFVKPEDK